MNSTVPLLAAINADVVETILVLVVIVVGTLLELIMKTRQAQPPGGRARPQQPPRPVPKDAADEIDDFLRRAAGQRTPQAAGQRTAQAAQPARVAAAGAAAPKPVVAEVVAVAPVGGQVTEHVQKYIDTEQFTRRGAQLGEEVVAEVDREIDQHLRQVFDHSVSRLAAVPGEAATPPVAFEPLELSEASAIEIPATFATGLTDLLTSAESIRQAIVLNEILHRPEERWA